MAAIMALFGMVGAVLGGSQGMLLALVLGAATNVWAYWFSDTMVLKLYNAHEIDESSAPQLYQTVRDLALRAGLPMPKVYLIDEAQPNAFATGRNPHHASVAVTRGILELCDDEEIEGVLAHELGHVRNRDILTSAVVATLAGAITMIARMVYYAELFGFGGTGGGGSSDNRRGGVFSGLAMLIVAPLAAVLIQLWVSRTREYEADHTGAEITGNPMALARALDKIDKGSKRLPMNVSPSMSHMYISAPFSSGQFLSGLFSTHPPIPKRIERLIGRDFV